MIFVVSCICARVCIIIGVKLLIFQARHFSWKAFSKTLESAPDVESSSGAEGDEAPRHAVEDAVVVFFHAEAKDSQRFVAAARAEEAEKSDEEVTVGAEDEALGV